jgi:hypothetical protein
MSLIKAITSIVASRVAAIAATAGGAALLAYFRTEAGDGIKWLLGPITRLLPWHSNAPKHVLPSLHLSSELTSADLFLLTRDGKHAIYAKTGSYVVGGGSVNSYFEGVTAAGNVSCFSTELGVITETAIEHGFYVSRIDLGSVLETGVHFRNVYRAQLDDCFTDQEEHWTQEIAVQTNHLSVRIHFPPERPPTLVRCKRVVGLAEQQIKTAASIITLSGQPAIVWEIEHPKLGDIYKLEWRW